MASVEDIKLLQQQVAELRLQITNLLLQQGQPLSPPLLLTSEVITPGANPNITFSEFNGHFKPILTNGLNSSSFTF